MSDNQLSHHCMQQDTIKDIWSKLHEIDTRQAVQESDMKTVKSDITEMKSDIKILANETKAGFEKQDNKSSKMVWFLLSVTVGALVNIGLMVYQIIVTKGGV